jgi:hypothetical protein
MGEGYFCSICDEYHAGLLTDWAFKLPDIVWAIPEVERAEQARCTNDLCQFGERYFIRCVLYVPFTDEPGGFGWGAWAEVRWPTFERYLELYDKDGTLEPVHAGRLANHLPAYAASLDMRVLIQFNDPTKRPLLHLEAENESLLATEQRAGITEARYHEISRIMEKRRAS